MAHAGEEQPHARPSVPQPVDRVQQRQRIEPVVDASTPEDHFVVDPDTGHHAAQRGREVLRRLILDAERHHGEQRAEIGAVVVGVLVEPPDGRELAEPEVALTGAGTQEEVAAPELLVDDVDRGADRSPRRASGSSPRVCSSTSR